MRRKRVSILSLGCSKNLVDSERLARRFSDAGLQVRFVEELPHDGSVLVVNTCGFIGDAKEESVNTLLGAIELKNNKKIGGVYAMGCLTERYRKELTEEMPELDGIYGKFDWAAVVDAVSGHETETKAWARDISTLPHYAYLKISEGCDRFCAFCVIAQDLSSYGRDLSGDGSPLLAELIDRMAQIDGVGMIRLHYAYPSDFPYDILPVMARNPKVCKYLDIALQHIDDGVLSGMRRHITGAQTRKLLDVIRREVPGIHIRTTMMVGFPGETDEAFDRLIKFVKEQRFERLGAFAYCEEEGTFAARNLPDSIPEDVKQRRLDRLMEVQQDIAFEVAEEKIGSTLRVIIDECDGTNYVGRTEFDSPEVDCNVYFTSPRRLNCGDIVNVVIDGTDEFDLRGHLAE